MGGESPDPGLSSAVRRLFLGGQMESQGLSGREIASPIAIKDDGGVFDGEDEDFESVYDVPFMTVNRIGDEYQGEVVLSGDYTLDLARVQTVLDAGTARGQYCYARKHGLYGTILIFFAPSLLGALCPT